MADVFDEVMRLVGEHKRRARIRGQIERRDAAVLEEERRVAAWVERPEWRAYWDEAANEFKVPAGWPPGYEREPERPASADEPEPERTRDTIMHKMLTSSRGRIDTT